MHPNATAAAQQRRRVQTRIDNADAYGLFNLLIGPQLLDDVESLLPAHRERLFPPTETLAMFMAQALSADGSCRQAVDDAAVKRLVAGLPRCISKTPAYCKARTRLPQPMISTLACRTGALVVSGVADGWLWRGRRVLLTDGTTLTLADTEEHQDAYSPAGQSTPGLGVPEDAPGGAAVPGQRRLARCRRGTLRGQGQRPADAVSRLARQPRRRRRAARRRLLPYRFPARRAAPPGRRRYWRRWHVELDLRNIKATLGMETLRCRRPEMARKELWVYLLAYNLIRLLMAQAALLADQVPRQLSFKHTVQVWLSWHQRGGGSNDGVVMHGLLLLIAEPRVGLRPGRIEPRQRKRRHNTYPLMTKPRSEAR